MSNYSAAQLGEIASRLTPSEQAELADILEAEERRVVDANCREWIVSHKRGVMYWLREHTRTENYHWREQNLPPVAPFPQKPHELSKKQWRDVISSLPFPHDFTDEDPPDYLDVVMGYVMTSKEIYVPKTREMMTSWLVVGFITWFCQFYEKVEWIGQSEDDEKAQGLIKYANILYSNQPDWLKALHPLKRGEAGTLHRVEWDNGSSFLGVPSGERKLASKHPYGYFNDETGHQPAAQNTVDVARPAVKQIICVSSVAPGWFWNEVQEAL